MSTKPLIAIDIDDVLGAENEAVRQFMNDNYGSNHTPEDYLVKGQYWGYWENIWDLHPKEAEERFQAYLSSPTKDELKLVAGAKEAIKKLKDQYELVVVTSRNGRQIQTTQPWLEQHFPGVFKQVEFVAVWGKDRKISKAIICKEIGADYLIDDNAEHCNLAQEAGIQALLFGNYGWNRSAKVSTGVVRVSDWPAVSEYFYAKS